MANQFMVLLGSWLKVNSKLPHSIFTKLKYFGDWQVFNQKEVPPPGGKSNVVIWFQQVGSPSKRFFYVLVVVLTGMSLQADDAGCCRSTEPNHVLSVDPEVQLRLLLQILNTILQMSRIQSHHLGPLLAVAVLLFNYVSCNKIQHICQHKKTTNLK